MTSTRTPRSVASPDDGRATPGTGEIETLARKVADHPGEESYQGLLAVKLHDDALKDWWKDPRDGHLLCTSVRQIQYARKQLDRAVALTLNDPKLRANIEKARRLVDSMDRREYTGNWLQVVILGLFYIFPGVIWWYVNRRPAFLINRDYVKHVETGKDPTALSKMGGAMEKVSTFFDSETGGWGAWFALAFMIILSPLFMILAYKQNYLDVKKEYKSSKVPNPGASLAAEERPEAPSQNADLLLSQLRSSLHQVMLEFDAEAPKLKPEDCGTFLRELAAALQGADLMAEAGPLMRRVDELLNNTRRDLRAAVHDGPAAVNDFLSTEGQALRPLFRTLFLFDQRDRVLEVWHELANCAASLSEAKDAVLGLVVETNVDDFEAVSPERIDEAVELLPRFETHEAGQNALCHLVEAATRMGYFEKSLDLSRQVRDPWLSDMHLAMGISEAIRTRRILTPAKLEEALEVARNLTSASNRQMALFRLADGLASVEADDRAKEMLAEAESIATDEHDYVPEQAASILAALGLFDQAIQTAKGIGLEARRASTMLGIATALAADGQVARSLALADDTSVDRAEAYRSVCEALAEVGRLAEARVLSDRIRDEDERSQALAAIAGGLAKDGRTQELIELVAEIPQRYRYRAEDALLQLVETLARADKAGDAVEVAHAVGASHFMVKALAKIYVAHKG